MRLDEWFGLAIAGTPTTIELSNVRAAVIKAVPDVERDEKALLGSGGRQENEG